jgi:hypothetical protein
LLHGFLPERIEGQVRGLPRMELGQQFFESAARSETF